MKIRLVGDGRGRKYVLVGRGEGNTWSQMLKILYVPVGPEVGQ